MLDPDPIIFLEGPPLSANPTETRPKAAGRELHLPTKMGYSLNINFNPGVRSKPGSQSENMRLPLTLSVLNLFLCKTSVKDLVF